MNNQNIIITANCQRPITDEEIKRFSFLQEHYDSRIKTIEAVSESSILWMKIHLRYIKKVLESGMIGSYEN